MASAPAQSEYSAVGIIEVMNLSAALYVADVLAKAAAVRIAGIESNHAGGMAIKFTGSSADVRAAVEAGRHAAGAMNAEIGAADWGRYSPQADFLVHSAQEYNALLSDNDHLLPGEPALQRGSRREGHMPNPQAIGFIETQGLVGLLEAADVVCKAADVHIVGKEKIGAGFVTVIVEGDVAAVKAAVEAGSAAVSTVGGKLILAHVIARPHDELVALLPPRGK